MAKNNNFQKQSSNDKISPSEKVKNNKFGFINIDNVLLQYI